ncbi:glutathione S-transferase [Mycena rebaudengoi]|nr:glutathione S-transferase [Mycena rebaudengoi]
MVLKIYSGANAAGGAALVGLVLAEKQIPFEHIFVNLSKGEHKTPEFLEKHPFGQIPVIDDDGFILCESRAICRYLSEKYADQGTPLIPTDLKARAIFEQAASFEFANFHPHAFKAAMAFFRGENVANPALVTDAVAALSKTLDVYEKILEKQKFLAGNEITLVDIFHLGFAPGLAGRGEDIMVKKGPNVTRWWNDLIQRPTWVKLKAEGMKGTAN